MTLSNFLIVSKINYVIYYLRKCICKNTFKNERGLKNHQGKKSNFECYRHSIWNKRKIHVANKKSKKYGPLPSDHQNLYEKHPRGSPFDIGDKRSAINCYQTLVEKYGLAQSTAIRHTANLTGIHKDSITRYGFFKK